LITVSIQDIRQNPQDISNFYLENTYKATINPNRSSSLPTSPPSFSPPNYAVWVNALWFLSLAISLTCALFATFLQQWARRYLKVTRSRYSLEKRARIRAFFAEGVDKYHLPWVVETLPILLHISLFLFFAGLAVFLLNVNLTIFKVVLSWVAISAALYGCITLMPIIRHDSPYYTSLSSLVWSIVNGMVSFVSVVRFLLHCVHTGFSRPGWLIVRTSLKSLSHGMKEIAEKNALKSPSAIDTRVFLWTFESLDEDHELERFFAGLPGFRSSEVVDDPLPRLSSDQMRDISSALDGLLCRTLSSDLLPDSIKKRSAMILAKALDLKHFPHSFDILEFILSKFHYSGPLAIGIAEILRGWRDDQERNDQDEGTVLKAQAIISNIVTRMQPRDDSWFILASKELGFPEAVLREYATQGDSLSLAILIHVVRQQFNHFWNMFWSNFGFSFVLLAASKFDARNTSPELQHQFCALWNQIVRQCQNEHDRPMSWHILNQIRNIYLALHQDTDSAATRFSKYYPPCNLPDHHPHPTPHIHDDSASTTSAHIVLPSHDNPALIPTFLARRPGSTSAPVHAPHRVDGSIDAPPPNEIISLSSQTALELESRRIHSFSPNSVTTCMMHRGIDTSPRIMSLSTPEPSTSSLQALTSPPDFVAVEHNATSQTASPAPVLDDIVLPTCVLSPSDSAVAGSDYAFSSPESHSSMLVPTSHRPSCSGMSAAAEKEDAKAAVCIEEDTIPSPPSAIRDDITITTPNLLLQSPSPTGLSQSSLDVYRGNERSSSVP
jgi:hypothetical protein